jgi:hypothetical protein
LVFLTTDSKVYRYDSSVPEFTTLVNTTDLSGTLGDNLFSDTLRPVERVGTLPTTGLTTGRVVMLTTDGKLYRYNGTSWTSAISAADLDDQLNLATQASGLLPVANAASGLVNGNITINADGSLSGAGSGQATLTGLGGGAVATLDTITETYIGSNSISTAKIQANAITANEILAGAVTAAKVAALAISADKIAANAITTAKIAAGAITADQIAAGSVSADAIAANAVTAAKIAANSVSASEIVSNSITTAELNVSQIFADSAVIGAIQASSITSAAIDAAVANFEFVESVNIASNAITAGKIAASAVTANKISVVNLAAISADLGTITAGTVNADVIKLDNVTMDTDANNNLVIKNSGVDSVQIKSNALGTIKSVVDDVEVATQFVPAASLFTASTPFHKYSTYTLDLLAELTFTSPLTTSETVDYVIRFESDVDGSIWSDSVGMITTHIQRTNSLGDSYDINGTRTGDDNQYYFEVAQAGSVVGGFRIPRAATLRGGSTIYLKLYGYQKNVYQSTTTPRTGVGNWALSVISVEGLAR